MALIRLGSNVLRWCGKCNVPILERKECPRCKGPAGEVSLTPPGDCRPAFEYDLKAIRRVADEQFGEGCGDLLLPPGRIAILNRCPDLDRMDEIVSDGEVVAALAFDPVKGDRLILRIPGARRILSKMKGKVTADPGAIASIMKGSNLMGPGVLAADDRILIGDEVAVIDPSGKLLGTGAAKKSGTEMSEAGKGIAVKVRWVAGEDDAKIGTRSNDWTDAVEANKEYIESKAKAAVGFVRDLANEHKKPIAVSFSGGKDSLATLQLVLESGIRPYIMFADTGLELDETVDEVSKVAKETGLELLVEGAGDSFWEDLKIFGPPGKDFRWCCKTCKLGPTTRLIKKNFPDGVLSFIGQRAYESEQRMRKGAVWTNPWVPGQIGASPIQKWNSLLVWMFIFSRKLSYNPWYERGLDRIGCFMCPSSDIAELNTVRDQFPGYSRWADYIEAYRKERELPDEWASLAIWRWKRLPPAMRNRIEQMGLHIDDFESHVVTEGPLKLRTASGYRPCTEGGLSMEGVFSRKLDLEKVQNLLNIIGPVEYLKDENIAKTGKVIVFGEGAVKIKGEEERRIKDLVSDIEQIARRAMFCVGCGICVGRCRTGALSVAKTIRIDESKCSHCGECLGSCPVLAFGKDVE